MTVITRFRKELNPIRESARVLKDTREKDTRPRKRAISQHTSSRSLSPLGASKLTVSTHALRITLPGS